MEARGGPWTTTKLDKVRRYLVAYQKVFLNQPSIERVYIDAFCGSGRVQLRGAREFTEGSALQAIALDTPFSRYHFIEKSKRSLERLREQISTAYPQRLDRVHFHSGDVNEVLPGLVAKLDRTRNRAVVFADPYGMQLDWSTVEAVASKPIIDFWLLVPTGIGVRRLATKNPRTQAKPWADRLDRFLGEPGWRERWYKTTGQTDLFGGPEEMYRAANLTVIDNDFKARLQSVFPCVADNILHLGDGHRVLFSLMFACSNPSEKAQGAAKRIANHLLKE